MIKIIIEIETVKENTTIQTQVQKEGATHPEEILTGRINKFINENMEKMVGCPVIESVIAQTDDKALNESIVEAFKKRTQNPDS